METYAPEHIIALDAGWVFSGTLVPGTRPGTVEIQNAAVIRRWGTTEGLGQLCLTGATPETILDFCTAPCVPESRVLFTLPVESGPWKVA